MTRAERVSAPKLYTIGHSTHEIGEFLGILEAAGIRRVVDVRSHPHSKWSPQYNQGALREALERVGITYEWQGPSLGGRPEGEEFYTGDGRVRYGAVAETTEFSQALDTLISQSRGEKTAVMCAEKDPEKCHRRLLVARAGKLAYDELTVTHILADGSEITEEALAEGSSAVGSQPALFSEESETEWLSAVVVRDRAGQA